MRQRPTVGNILLWLSAIAFAFLFPHFGLIPVLFAYSIPVLILLWLVLKRTKENFSSIGFNPKKLTLHSVLVGIAAGILLFAFLNYVFFPALNKFVLLPKANLADFNSIRHHFFNYLFVLSMGWLIGGWYEELVFHGFIFTRFEKILSKRYALTASFIVTNFLFGLYHFQLGTSGMINAFLAGCAYQALALRYKRNLWYAFFCHGFFDTIGLTFIYLGYW
ncbi:CPBP family intramembrane glutamic endopeptidase [Flavisolibacter ginsenosidimutans]|uniref:CPBP family intramembrane metalloprotease n=1 Tax=Flavisolibacter ginsenosidimutans TaxID=661481 RepID=A0A5B8UHW6_9BACT|nr:CPBP family intramembrane glutamic endopeptidase [Flavisolibacter ginsenosidimutans]QEC55946.1 CPBP family intramembrane metalloprotease [Flavisolibacter ginsenosidimutans]